MFAPDLVSAPCPACRGTAAKRDTNGAQDETGGALELDTWNVRFFLNENGVDFYVGLGDRYLLLVYGYHFDVEDGRPVRPRIAFSLETHAGVVFELATHRERTQPYPAPGRLP